MYREMALWKKQGLKCCVCKEDAKYSHINHSLLVVCEKCHNKLGDGEDGSK